MWNRTIWDEFADLRRSFDRVFDNFYNDTRQTTSGAGWAFAPAVETGWTDDFLNLRFVLPGVRQEDLKVSHQGNKLMLQGERVAPKDFGKEGSVFQRLPYGKFERTLELPAGVDVEHLQAYLHDGLLDLRIPIAQAVKPKQVKIMSGNGDAQKSIAA